MGDVKKMKTPWINRNQPPPKQMFIFKSSTAKKKNEEEKEPTENKTKEPKVSETKAIQEFISVDPEPALSTQVETEIIYPEMTNEIQPYKQGKIYLMTKKIPFSVYVEIDNFQHQPICGDIAQHQFEFSDLAHQQTPELDTKLLHTTNFSHEEPECRLICSNIHEMVFLTNTSAQNIVNNYKTTVVPLHDLGETETEEYNGSYLHIRIPVVLGEYKIEVCLEENIEFKEEVLRIKEISKEIILTNFKLVPTVFSPSSHNGMRNVLKGNLWLEGCIAQKIEYTALNRGDVSPVSHLAQKIVAELIVHVLQVQKARVKK